MNYDKSGEQKKDYKILNYVDDLIDSFKEPVERLPGLIRKPKDIIRTIEFYTSSQYLSGNKDELGRDKPFYEVSNYRVTTAKVGTDIDIKDIRYEPDSLQYSVQTMIINKELFKVLKEITFSKTLNDFGLTRPKYGEVLLKRSYDGDTLKIETEDWVNVDFDPSDVKGGAKIVHFYLQPSEFSSKRDVWENVEETLEAHAKAHKNKPAKIHVIEIEGDFPETFDPEINKPDKSVYKKMCFYLSCVGKKKFFLYKEDQKASNFKALEWEKVGDGFGRGVVESGFEAQWAINDTMISLKNAMELTTKVVGQTTSKKVKGSVVADVQNGHIFELEPNATLSFQNLGNINLPQFQVAIDLWNTQFDRVSSTYNANTGEAPTSGTPYSQTALLNQVANSPFEYQREVAGIFINEVLNDWVLPYVKKRILKEHYLVAEYTDDELDMIDEAISNWEVGKQLAKAVLNEDEITQEGVNISKEQIKQELIKANGKKRELKIPAKWLDINGKITANITGELKNKQAILQSLDSVLGKLISTYNPQTGKFAALEDKTLASIFGQIVDMAGIPISFAQLKGTTKTQSPMQSPMQPDLSAIRPMTSPVASSVSSPVV